MSVPCPQAPIQLDRLNGRLPATNFNITGLASGHNGAHRVATWDDRVVKRWCDGQMTDCLADQARGCDYDAGDKCS